MTELATKITDTLRRAGLNPRVLGGLTKIHYTTIYSIVKSPDANPTPVVESTLNRVLSDIERLVNAGKLPLEGRYTTEQKIPMVESLIGLD